MNDERTRCRLVLAAGAEVRPLLRALLEDAAFRDWDVVTAGSLAQAHFFVQHEHWDALVLDESLIHPGDGEALAWLGRCGDVPLFLLVHQAPALIGTALRQGVRHWLPRDLALGEPDVLANLLATCRSGEMAPLTTTGDRCNLERCLQDSQRRVSRLLNILWQTAAVDPQTHWLTQRHMMERLQEELARAARYGTPFSVAIGELENATDGRRRAWAAQRLLQAKRAADVIGHYGPNGFMLLLVHTPENGAAQCCRRLRRLLAQGPPQGPHGFGVHVCFGIAGYSSDVGTAHALLSQAERRLEKARAALSGVDALR